MDESLKQRRGNAVLSFIIIIIIIIISTSSVIISMEHSLLQDCQLEHHVTHVTRSGNERTVERFRVENAGVSVFQLISSGNY